MVTTIPDLAWLVQEVGQNKVKVTSLLNGKENPHFSDAVPSFIHQVAQADLVCLVGLDLEVGWLPKVLSKSGNAKVQPGGAGYCETGSVIEALDKPTGKIDRSMGDVHAAGNPHFWLSPIQMIRVAEFIAEKLISIQPKNSRFFLSQLNQIQSKLRKTHQRNYALIQSALKGFPKTKSPVIEYHKEFTYLLDAYGLSSFGAIEEKPGVPPSAGRLAIFGTRAKSHGVKLGLAATYSPRSTLRRFQEISGIPIVIIPTSVQLDGKWKDYLQLQNEITRQIVTRLKRK